MRRGSRDCKCVGWGEGVQCKTQLKTSCVDRAVHKPRQAIPVTVDYDSVGPCVYHNVCVNSVC